jgi:Spy/CpxP family protein refolding chaperone
MRKIHLVSAALVTALACAPLAFAQPTGHAWHGHHHHHGMAMGGHMYRQLDLSDAQRTQIKQLARDSFTQSKPQMQSLRQARQAFNAATPGTAAYQTSASNLAEAEADAARVRSTSRADLRAKIYQVLTSAQRTQLASLQAERQAKMKQWRASHKHGGNTTAPDSSATAQ